MTAVAKIDGHHGGSSCWAGVGFTQGRQDVLRPVERVSAQRSQNQSSMLFLVGIPSSRTRPRNTEPCGAVWRNAGTSRQPAKSEKSTAARRAPSRGTKSGHHTRRCSAWAALQAAHHDNPKRLSRSVRLRNDQEAVGGSSLKRVKTSLAVIEASCRVAGDSLA